MLAGIKDGMTIGVQNATAIATLRKDMNKEIAHVKAELGQFKVQQDLIIQ